MRRRISEPDPRRSIVENAEYGLTAILVFVVVVAVMEIFGIHLGFKL